MVICKKCSNFVRFLIMKTVFLHILSSLFVMLVVSSCKEQPQATSHFWGDDSPVDSITRNGGVISFDEIISNGEILAATVSGPDTYYEYKGISVGSQYMLLKMFTEEVGLKIRLEVCKDTAEVLGRLKNGEIDVALMKLPVINTGEDFICCAKGNGTAGWYVNAQNASLAEAIDKWYKPGMVTQVREDEDKILSNIVTTQRTISYYLNREAGVISEYDELFKLYSAEAGVDWRLLASICYQESHFDPKAESFAGASGLMQLMPKTAESMGLSRAEIFDPAKNVCTSARYLNKLKGSFGDIANADERLKFVLAGYNGGTGHIRDAMALCKADGKDCKLWNNVAPYVLALSNPSVYNRPMVKFGYMRGVETVNYVSQIFNRWYDYRGVISGPAIYSASDLSIENIIGTPPDVSSNEPSATAATDANRPSPSEGSSATKATEPTRKANEHREMSDHSLPVPATTQRKAKYDVE